MLLERATTDSKKLCFDSAATCHRIFITWYLQNVRDAGKTIRGNCNAGVKLCTNVGDLGVFKMWINEGGIANLLSIPQLEKDDFRVTSDTHREWIVYSPRGEKLIFKRDTGNLKNMPYIDVDDVTTAFALEAFAHANIEAVQEERIQTVRKNMEGFSRKEVKREILARAA